MFNKFCRWLDSNRGPLVSEATAQPTEPQPLPNKHKVQTSLEFGGLFYFIFDQISAAFQCSRFYKSNCSKMSQCICRQLHMGTIQSRASSSQNQEPMSSTNFRVVYSCCVEIKHSDWLKLVMAIGTANQSSLFQCSISMLL